MNNKLVVACRIKRLIHKESGLRVSNEVITELNRLVRQHCLNAITNTEKTTRSIVKGRDVANPIQLELF